MASRRSKASPGPADPLWYKDAVVYELHVRAFCDADGNGVGDFKGLTTKLDYLQQLGVTAIWLLPFYPSPLRDDGYDIADYLDVHPLYGKLKHFEVFLEEAHRRDLKVITELVVNHTSDQHPWFQQARRSARGRWRDFYVWAKRPDRYADARIIFKDFESSNWTYDPLAKEYFWHRFYSHQPDLNYDNPAVQRAVMKVMDLWFDMGVDGMRLDAVPYLFEREGTDCENLPQTHEFLRHLRRHVDRKHRNRMLLGEANQWPEDAAAYFGDGDECHMNFHFPLMPRLFMALQMEDSQPIVDILGQTPEIPETAQWALFLRNHDELTLEMVTDEERDYMNRVYARERRARINLGIRRRLAPLLGNNRRAIELMNAILFSLPGTPVIYYGDEIGMGDNIYLGDRNGVRTPMQWSADRNAGFSRANPQSLYLPVIIDPEYHYETVNVEAQTNNPNSLLWWMRRLIAMRKRHKAFGRGDLHFVSSQNRKVLTYVRRLDGEVILVVANLSRHVEHARLELAEYAQRTPVEMFGANRLPVIADGLYDLTLAPHAFYWLVLQSPERKVPERGIARPLLRAPGQWQAVLAGEAREELEEILPGHLQQRRWFGGKARTIESVHIDEVLRTGVRKADFVVLFLRVDYVEGQGDSYMLPLSFATGEQERVVETAAPFSVVARVLVDGPESVDGILYDASSDPGFATWLLDCIRRGRSLQGERGEALCRRSKRFGQLTAGMDLAVVPRASTAEQSNTSLIYGDRLILKLYRRLGEGLNPDVEIGRFLTERRPFPHTPGVAGWIEYEQGDGTTTLAFLQGYVANSGDAWSYALHQLDRFFEAAASRYADVRDLPIPASDLVALVGQEAPPLAGESIGAFLESARQLGRRTAELHVALARDGEHPDFAPETFTPFYRRSLQQSLRNLTTAVLGRLRRGLTAVPEPSRAVAEQVARSERQIHDLCQRALSKRIHALRTRTHGDFHLGQVLCAGTDFVIIDFEGEPARPLGERRLKRSPLRDVAGMIRSFHYASLSALASFLAKQPYGEAERARLQEWASMWWTWVAAEFLGEYLRTAEKAPFLAACPREEVATLLGLFCLEKAVYELGYELDNRPDWVHIPLAGIRQALGGMEST
ncbi:MAG: maltose alpha-D-glucosyltransferase [Planctomycetota bacterium]